MLTEDQRRQGHIAAKLLREAREGLGLTVSSVAERLGVTPQRYLNWETFLGPLPAAQYGGALSRVLSFERESLWPSTLAYTGHADLPTSVEQVIEGRRLGARAASMRLQKGLAFDLVARELGIDGKVLAKLERRLPEAPHPVEPRWEALLGVPPGWLRESHSTALEGGPLDISGETLSDVIRAAGTFLVTRIDPSIPLKKGLSPAMDRAIDMFCKRHGVDGEDLCTLQAIGDAYALTRERVRQILDKVNRRLPSAGLRSALMPRIRDALHPHLPCTIDRANAILAPLLGNRLTIRPADAFCREMFGESLVEFIDFHDIVPGREWTDSFVAESRDGVEMVRAVRDSCVRMVRNCGAAHIYFVAGAASATLGRGITPDDVLRLLEMSSRFEWLQKFDGWFWLGPDSDSRLITTARKLLSISPSAIDVEEIAAGMSRSRRTNLEEKRRPWMLEPPFHVILEVLKRSPDFGVRQSDNLYPVQSIDPASVLGDGERMVLDMMRRDGGVSARWVLTRELVETGKISMPGLNFILDGSPIITRLRYGVYALRGFDYSSQAVVKAISMVGGEDQPDKVSLDPSENGDGWFAYPFHFGGYFLRSSVFSLRVAAARLMPLGEYRVVGGDMVIKHGQTSDGDHRLLGVTSALRTLGFQDGDNGVLHVQPSIMQIEIERVADPDRAP